MRRKHHAWLLCAALASCSSDTAGSSDARARLLEASESEAHARATAPLREQRIAHEGVELAYIELGDPAAQPVLLLHGQRFDKRTWERLGTMDVLAKAGYRAIAIDLPGHGGSANTPEPANIDEFLYEFVRGVLWVEPVLVAPSMSGRYALPFAALHPAALNGFVPIAPAGVAEHTARLRGSLVSSLIVWGERDDVLPESGARELQALLARSELSVLPDAGHACYLDQPERFHALLLDWLRRNAPARR